MKRPLVPVLFALAVLALGAQPLAAAPVASLRVTGTIAGVTSSSLQLTASDGRSLTFRLVATTTYAKDGQPASASVLAPGETARVKYHQEANGSLKAKEVEVLTPSGPPSPPVVVRANLLALTTTEITIAPLGGGPNLTVRLAPTTLYEIGDRTAAVTDLRVGEELKVKYRREGDGSLKAQKVKVVPAVTHVAFQLEGTIVHAGALLLRVRVRGALEGGVLKPALGGTTVSVAVTAATTVTENGRAARAGALTVGERVHITGLVSGGAFSAQHVVAQRIGKKR